MSVLYSATEMPKLLPASLSKISAQTVPQTPQLRILQHSTLTHLSGVLRAAVWIAMQVNMRLSPTTLKYLFLIFWTSIYCVLSLFTPCLHLPFSHTSSSFRPLCPLRQFSSHSKWYTRTYICIDLYTHEWKKYMSSLSKTAYICLIQLSPVGPTFLKTP